MRKYENRKVEREFKLLIEINCDLCGKLAKNGSWESSTYEVNETEIEIEVRYKNGDSYPDVGQGQKFNVDICPDCFKEKLIPYLKSQGCETQFEDWEW